MNCTVFTRHFLGILAWNSPLVIGCAVAVVGIVILLAVLLTKHHKQAEEEAPAPKSGKLFAPITGKTIPVTEVEDEVFSSGALGDGIAIIPEAGEVYAPCDGEISTFFPTGHAIGITAPDGAEILIHVGMNTVELKGEGFEPMAKEGDTVRKGQLLLKFDMDMIAAKGYKLETPMIVTNMDVVRKLTPAPFGSVTAGDEVAEYEL